MNRGILLGLESMESKVFSHENPELGERQHLDFLMALSLKFKIWSSNEFLAFIEENAWITGNLLPVNGSKKVVVPEGTKTIDCRLTTVGLNHMIHSFGMETAFDGIPGSKGVVAWAVAAQCRHRTVHIDFDLDVFRQLPASSSVPGAIVDWVIEHQDAALFTRGNRGRMTMFLEAAPELRNHLTGLTTRKHKRRFKIKDTINGAIEVFYGVANNNLYGTHPSAGKYQQIGPKDNKLGQLSLSSFERLIELLDEHSYAAIGDDEDFGGVGGRVMLEDCPEVLLPVRNAVKLRTQLLSSQGLEVTPIKLSIREFLNPKTLEILEGKCYFDGDSNYIDATSKPAIPEGFRRSTYINVGSDINQVVELFNEVEIEYDESDIDEIVDVLWNVTDAGGTGAHDSHFTEEEALEALSAYPYTTYKYTYLVKLAIATTRAIAKSIQDLRPKKKLRKSKTRGDDGAQAVQYADDPVLTEKIQEIVAQANALEGTDTVVPDGDDSDDLTAFIQDFVDDANDAAKYDEKSPFAIDEDVVEELSDRIALEKELHQRVFSDNYELIHPLLRGLVQGNLGDTAGFSYSFIALLFAATMPLFGNAKVANSDNGRLHITTLNPFSLILGMSASGKTRVLKPFKPMIEMAKWYLAPIDPAEIEDFQGRFCDDKGKFLKLDANGSIKPVDEDDFQEIEVTTDENETDSFTGTKLAGKRTAMIPLTDDQDDEADDTEEFTLDPDLQNRRIQRAFGLQSARPEHLKSGSQYIYLSVATEAGARDAFLDQQLGWSIKTVTGDVCTSVYPRPVGLIMDEIGGLLNKVFDEKNHTFTPYYVCARKSQDPIAASTSTQRSGIIRQAGFTISGAMTTDNFLDYLRKEIVNATDGFIPRFNLNLIESEDEKPRDGSYVPISTDNSEQLLSVYLVVFGVIVNTISRNPEWFEEPLQIPMVRHGSVINIDIHNNKEAQIMMSKFRNEVLVIRDEMKTKYETGLEQSFIDSFTGKSWQEVAIYAGTACIVNQLLDLTHQIIGMFEGTTDDLIKVAFGGSNDISGKFVRIVKNGLLGVTKHIKMNWRREVSVEEMKLGCEMYKHSLYTLDFLLSKLSVSAIDDLSSRAKLRTAQSVLKQAGDKTYQLENQVSKLFNQLVKLNSSNDIASFTVASNLVNRSRVVARLFKTNPGVIDKIIELLTHNGLLRESGRTPSGNVKYSFREGLSSNDILRFRRIFLESMFEVGNERM